jgi:phosphoribosyl-AMP cyclohydrolase
MQFPIDTIKFDADGLIPAIIQHFETKEILMLGFMNKESLLRTIEEKKVCFWSRSRQKFWLKGETSGMFLQTKAVRINCENNSLLILADPIGPTCHTGHESCYYREATEAGKWDEIMLVITDPKDLYKK